MKQFKTTSCHVSVYSADNFSADSLINIKLHPPQLTETQNQKDLDALSTIFKSMLENNFKNLTHGIQTLQDDFYEKTFQLVKTGFSVYQQDED